MVYYWLLCDQSICMYKSLPIIALCNSGGWRLGPDCQVTGWEENMLWPPGGEVAICVAVIKLMNHAPQTRELTEKH